MATQPKPLKVKQKSSYISPFLVNSSPIRCVVGSDGLAINVQASSEATCFVLDEHLAPETPLKLAITRQGVRVTLQSEEEAYAVELRTEAQSEAAKKGDLLRQMQLDKQRRASDFNKSLKIPVNWTPDIKIVLSGLGSNGFGDGTNKATVHHVRLLEPLADGRLFRSAGDFLCGANQSSFESTNQLNPSDRDYMQVTCKKCIRIAQRFKGEEK
ncbi:TPA: hypothetical protein I7551_16480 [Vibrio cholerae]|nr:hypothetical protein [Vibrio cholerae]